jgi:thiol-disulfide isomerase/thioredoxin
MKKLLLLCALFVIIGNNVSFADEIQWYSLKEGTEKAINEKKPTIVDFWFGVECPRCVRLQEDVYNNPIIAKKIMADFIPIRIDLSKPLSPEEEPLGEKFDYKSECLLIFLDHEGEVLSDSQGKRLCFIDTVDPDWFVSYLDMVKNSYRRR